MNRKPALAPLLALALVAGCNGRNESADAPVGPSVTQGEIEYTADTAILESFPVQLDTRVTMRNRSRQPAAVELGSGCPVLLRVYRNEARTTLVWDQGRVVVCTMQIQQIQLAAGDTALRRTRTDAREILGDSLPDGRYFLSAFVQVVGAPVTIPAGAVELAVPR